MSTDLWNKMVEETLSYKPESHRDVFAGEADHLSPDEQKNEHSEDEQNDKKNLKDCSGVVYFIDLFETEVSLRLEPKRCLQTSIDQLPANSFYFFETSSFELAEVIADHYHQKRFRGLNLFENGPQEEGFLWWLRNKNDDFELVIGCANGAPPSGVCLGFLGDENIAFERLLRSELLFSELGVKIKESKSNKIQFTAQTDLSEGLELCRKLFTTGEGLEQIYELLEGKMDLTMYFYLREVTVLRKFWLNFCHYLKKSTDNSLIH